MIKKDDLLLSKFVKVFSFCQRMRHSLIIKALADENDGKFSGTYINDAKYGYTPKDYLFQADIFVPVDDYDLLMMCLASVGD